MNKIKMRRKLKSAYISLSDMEKLCNIFIKFVHEENKGKDYKREANFEVILINGQAYQFSDTKEFNEQLKSDISNIKDIDLIYYGHDSRISLRFDSGLFFEIYLDIETLRKEDLLCLQDDFLRILNKESWNSITLNVALAFILAIGITVITFTLLSKLLHYDFLLKTSHLVTLFMVFMILGINAFLSKTYPALVLVDGDYSSGRIFRKDWWKFLCLLSSLVIIPIFINWLTKP